MQIQQPYDWSRGLWRDTVDAAFLDGLRAAVAAEVLPRADAIDRDDVYPVDVVQALAAPGYTSMTLPTRRGGARSTHGLLAARFDGASFARAAAGRTGERRGEKR